MRVEQIGDATLYCGDSLEIVPGLPFVGDLVDSVVTDPPYGLSFMGKRWDYDVPSEALWAAVLEVMKPGAHLLAFAGTRTQHRMAVRIEDAGFEIRDMIAWVYGCLSEDSEVLTDKGWMPYHTAKHEKVLAYDVENDVYQWETPLRWSEYRVEQDTAYRIVSDHTDQIVSRGHRCLVERGGVLTFVSADELSGVEVVPTLPDGFCGVPQGRGAVLQPAVQRLLSGPGLGEARAQGACGLDRRQQGKLRAENDGAEQPGVEGRGHVFQPQGPVCHAADSLRPVPGSVQGHGPEGRVCDASPVEGGGSHRAPAYPDGVRTSHQPRRDGQPAGELDALCDQRGAQAVRARPSYSTTLATVSAIRYSGLIWCPTVSTGAFVARRNGKVFVTGNSGFPKSLDVSKAIDKAAGAEREKIRKPSAATAYSSAAGNLRPWMERARDIGYAEVDGDQPATDAARQWQGWGTALKPALEPVTVARKPLTGTVAENVQTYGTGALNIDGCRVGDGADKGIWPVTQRRHHDVAWTVQPTETDTSKGRWPANLIHDGGEEVLACFPDTKSGKPGVRRKEHETSAMAGRLGVTGEQEVGYGDAGSAARFFYCPKASKADRGGDNNHPTVKPTELMRYLCRLVTPPGGVVLDPFMGSGSTGKGAMLEGFRFIGIERDPDYFEIACRRIEAAYKKEN